MSGPLSRVSVELVNRSCLPTSVPPPNGLPSEKSVARSSSPSWVRVTRTPWTVNSSLVPPLVLDRKPTRPRGMFAVPLTWRSSTWMPSICVTTRVLSALVPALTVTLRVWTPWLSWAAVICWEMSLFSRRA